MNIALAGYGVEGRSNYAYWSRQTDDAGDPLHSISIVDEREPENTPAGVSTIFGDGAFGRLNGFDMVVRSAGVAPAKIVTDGKIWSGANEFFEKCPAPIIGVTGSKGKGTTASLIASILRAAGKKVWLVGNIGVASLDVLEDVRADDIVVYELSSFQLWDLERSPHVAVVLHMEPDHLDVHADFDEYVAAKAHIARYQTTVDRIVYNTKNQWATEIASASVGQRLPYPSEYGVHVRDGMYYYGKVPICETENVLLPGVHNLDNAAAAITAVWPWVNDGKVIAEGLRGFDGLPHRLKFVREIAGVKYYDDSIATTPGSAIAAIDAFDAPKVLILGGSYKGADFTELAEKAAQPASNIAKILLIGDEASRIATALDAAHMPDYKDASDHPFAEVVQMAQREAPAGGVVVLSPACASFGQFKSYVDRGEQYIAAVNELNS